VKYKKMTNILLTIVAVILLLVGVISMITPFPGSVLIIAMSMSLLVCSNSKAQSCVRYVRTKNNRFDKGVFWMEEKVGTKIDFIGRALKNTRPIKESDESKI